MTSYRPLAPRLAAVAVCWPQARAKEAARPSTAAPGIWRRCQAATPALQMATSAAERADPRALTSTRTPTAAAAVRLLLAPVPDRLPFKVSLPAPTALLPTVS